MIEAKTIGIVKSDGIITNPSLYIYINNDRFSADFLVRLLNAVEALLYQSLIYSIRKIQLTLPGVTENSVSHNELKGSGKAAEYNYLNTLMHNFRRGYTSFLIEKYSGRRILDLHERQFICDREFINNKFWEEPDFDYEEFIRWIRSYSSATLYVEKIQTGKSLELIFDFATIASIISLQNYPIVDNIARFFIEKLKCAVKNKFYNPKSAEKEIINILVKDKELKIVIHEIEKKSTKYDISIQFGEKESIHYKAG